MYIENDKSKQNDLEAAGRFGLDGEDNDDDDDDDTDFINAQMNYGNAGIMAGGAGIIPAGGNQFDAVAAARQHMLMKEAAMNPDITPK